MAGVRKSPTKKSFFKAIFKHSLEAIAILDSQNRIVEINPAGCQLFAVARKKLIDKSITEFVISPLNWSRLQEGGEIKIKQPHKQVKTVEYSQVQDLLPEYNRIRALSSTN